MFLFDGALSLGFVINGSARQAITPDHFLARIGGGGMLLSGIVAISGNLFAGGMSEVVDPRFVLAFCGALLIGSSILALRFKQGNVTVEKLKPMI